MKLYDVAFGELRPSFVKGDAIMSMSKRNAASIFNDDADGVWISSRLTREQWKRCFPEMGVWSPRH